MEAKDSKVLDIATVLILLLELEKGGILTTFLELTKRSRSLQFLESYRLSEDQPHEFFIKFEQ